MANPVVRFWNKNKFKILVLASIIFIGVCWWYKEPSEKGSYSTSYMYIPTIEKQRATRRESKGETECRRVLESIFNSPFPNCRPDILRNPVTGKNLELDCYNAQYKIGCEYNGQQHYAHNTKWQKNVETFQNQQYRDILKKRACEDAGILLIVVPYWIPLDRIENFIREKLVSVGVLR